MGLAARNIEQKEGGDSDGSDHEETCEYCAAEKVNVQPACWALNRGGSGEICTCE